jgi:GNAT superfamily N-acetyltransferase
MLSENFMKVSIRGFVEQDRELCKQVLAELRDWFGIKSSNEAYISILGSVPTAVAVVDDEIIGFAALEQHNKDSIELHVIAVKKAYHNRGIGTKLINWAESWCRVKGVSWFHVKTRGPSTPDPGYEKTRKFYEAKEFVPLFESLVIWGPENAALVMVKKLTV